MAATNSWAGSRRCHALAVTTRLTGATTFVSTYVTGGSDPPGVPDPATAWRFDDVVRAVVSARGGTVMPGPRPPAPTTAVFATADDALGAAHRLHMVIDDGAGFSDAAPRLRIGVHTADPSTGGGAAADQAARLGDLAGPGETLVSGPVAAATTALPAGSTPVPREDGDDRAGAGAAFVLVSAQPATPEPPSTVADPGVSRREGEVLGLLGEHLTNAEIAATLYISERTVESHVSSLLRKLGATDRRDLARRARPAPAPVQDGRPLPPALALHADGRTFVGRWFEREVLRRQWELAGAGHTLVVIVTAEAGMGKSRLVAELAAGAHADGGRVLYGACHEDVEEPYGPFVQAIVDDAVALGPAEARRRASASADALARLSPELARALGTPPGRPPSHDADRFEQSMIRDAIRQWLTDSAATAPLLVVLEDLHWSTSTTRDVVRDLARRAARAPLLAVVTTRDSRPDLDRDLAAMLADLARSPSVRRLVLPGLDRDEVGRLVGAPSEVAEAIRAQTGGNPLLATHMVADPGRRSLPAWLFRRDAMLDDETRAVLDLAATFGAEFDADRLAAAHGAPLLRVLDCLEAAEAAGLVEPHPSRVAWFTFVHALFRSHRYDALAVRRRLELHARAAAALASPPDDDRVQAERARHACLALPLGDGRAAVELARTAAHRAEDAYAYDEAVTHYRRALEASRYLDPPDASASLGLTVRLGAALHHRGDPQGLPMLLDAARRARDAGDDDALVRAATAIPQFGAVGFVDAMPEGRVVTEAALAALGPEPSPDRARLLMDLAAHWLFLSVDEALRLAGRAEAIARDLDDREVLGAVLLSARHLLSHPAHLDERVRIGVELVELGRELGRLAMTLGGLHALGGAQLERGDVGAWRATFDRMIAALGEHSLAFFRVQTINHRANRAFLAGDLAGAESIVAETVPLSVGMGAGRVFAESATVGNRRLQGREAELIPRFERAAQRSSDAWYRCTLAALQARSGREDAARATLQRLRDEGFPIRKIYPWAVAVTDLAEAAEVVGDRDVAEHVLAVAGPYAGRIAVSGPHPNRPFDQALAQAALTVDRPAAAATYAEQAVAASRRRQTPVYLVRELVFLAEARRRTGATEREIRPLVTEAVELAERLGAGAALADIERYRLPR